MRAMIVMASSWLFVAPATADFIDWSTVTLSGSNPFTFQNPEVGEITLTYSGGYRVEGITSMFGGVPTLGLGSDGQLATLTVSWENPIESIEIRSYDLDLGEFHDFSIASGTQLSIVEASPFGSSNPLSGLRLSGTGTDVPNGAADNFSTVRIAGDPFTQFSVSFIRPDQPSGASSIGFGNFVVPAPPSVSLLCLAGIASRRRR